MAKEISQVLKLQIQAGQANPAPPVGPALGQAGVNIMDFCKEFNARTQKQAGEVLPTVISVYKDKSFSLRHQAAAGFRPAQESGRHRIGIRDAEQEEGRLDHQRRSSSRS